MALLSPLLPTAVFPISHSLTYLILSTLETELQTAGLCLFSSIVTLKLCIFIVKMCYVVEFSVSGEQSYGFRLQCCAVQ